ncbi:MAG: type IX secretion system protein PorQ [Saprospiraceae bacterium]
MKKINIVIINILILSSTLTAQISGKTSFAFLSSPASARITSLGGSVIGYKDEDINTITSNPALLNGLMAKQISFSHGFHFADIQYGYMAYGHFLKKFNLMTSFGIQYISYGELPLADNIGNIDGSFKAGEQVFSIGVAKKVADRIQLGTTLKFANSSIESYTSTGILADVGLMYAADTSSWNLAFVIKNIGFELSTYDGQRFGIPFDVQIGITKKLRYLPLRFSIIGHHLHLANVRYDDPNAKTETDIFGEEIEENDFANKIDNIFRHIIINGEFMLGKSQNFRFRIGYDHWRRKELSLSTFRSLAGFSGGIGISIKGFKLDYGVGYYHVAGATNHISIRTDMGRFFSKV